MSGGPNKVEFPGVPAFTDSPVRVEFYLHDWPDTGEMLFASDGIGMRANIIAGEFGTAIGLAIYQCGDFAQVYITPGQANDPALGSRRAYFRMQWFPSTKTAVWEAWDVNGYRFFDLARVYPSAPRWAGSTGLVIGDAYNEVGASRGIGFFRAYNTTVPANSRVPVTADDSASVINLKFDGNLKDSSGHGRNGSVTAGFVSYVSTPDQNVHAVVNTVGAPFWANTVTMRAGFPNQLDGRHSFSQADAKASVTCSWQVLPDAPSMPELDSETSCTPTITGLIFGDYPIQLTVTDIEGTQAVLTQHIGAVAMDSNGIVINANPDVDILFGPMIAWGRNPWGFADERQMRSTVLRNAYYSDLTQGHLGNPTWETPGQGTVSYTMGGKGVHPISPGATTLCAAIPDATTLSVTVCDATLLDLVTLPTRIKIEGEELRICSATENVLTVCYDGRGYATVGLAAASSHANGVAVGQYKITGTGTLFITDQNSPLCPAGAPSPPGAVLTSTGTVAVTAGSTALVGTGTGWVVGPNINTGTPGYVFAGQPVRVLGTHSGTPFTFLAQVASIEDSTHITMSRAFPSDADTASGLTYQILLMGQESQLARSIVLHYVRPSDSSDAKMSTPVSGCESETTLYIPYVNRDFGGTVPGLNGSAQSGQQYSYITPNDAARYLNSGSTGGINFYGPGIADRSLYYRSGIKLAETTANMIDDNWIKAPMVAGGDVGGIDLFLGAGVIGAAADAVLNPNRVNWSDLRGFARSAKTNFENAHTGGYCYGTRESAYHAAWLGLAAMYDPDLTQRAAWNTTITNDQIPYENACKNTDPSGTHPERVNSWANPYFADTARVALTNSSTAGTFTGPAVNICRDEAHGTATAINGSAALVGAGFVKGATSEHGIMLTGTKSGAAYSQLFYYTFISSTAMTLSGVWQGDTGFVGYIEMTGGGTGYYQLSFGSNLIEPDLYENYACTYNSGAGSFTLNRPWAGTSGNKQASIYNLSGFGQQPFMMGIKANAFRLESHLEDSTSAAAFADFGNRASNWVKDYGYYAPGHYLHYGRIFGGCEPDPNTAPGCVGDSSLNAEAQSTIALVYQANPTVANKLYGDQYYAAGWGNAAYTTGGVETSATYNSYFTQDGFLAGGKWPGFYFGMGMTHQWPAVRLGGVAPEQSRALPVAFNLASVATATQVTIRVTAPSGAKSQITCSTSPCMVKIDGRQGQHLVRLEYKNKSGLVLAVRRTSLPSNPDVASGVPANRQRSPCGMGDPAMP
jgi:hypothetical protein